MSNSLGYTSFHFNGCDKNFFIFYINSVVPNFLIKVYKNYQDCPVKGRVWSKCIIRFSHADQEIFVYILDDDSSCAVTNEDFHIS